LSVTGIAWLSENAIPGL